MCTLVLGACGRIGLTLLDDQSLGLSDGGLPGQGAGDASDGAIPGQGLEGGTGMALDAAPMPGSCELDRDDDGTVDCEDGCPDDPEKVAPGVCGCMAPDDDSDGDGLLDCVDSCGGSNDSAYEPDDTCGVGYCQLANTPSSCVEGEELACIEGAPRSPNDATCDGVDDNCDGSVDEDYAPTAACGVGYCRQNSTPSSCAGGVVTPCQPATPLSSNDATADGIDDDCDGAIDEDACVPRTDTFGVGSHTSSPGPCSRVTIKLWGGAGASGDGEGGYWASVTGGNGGAGGYAERQFTVTAGSSVQLFVGQGGQGCGAPGTNANTSFNGGTGATARGGDGSAGAGTTAGGTGANPSSGGRGGAGFFGAGGGGSGSAPAFAPSGGGGGGGAATAVVVDGTRMVAGGGGGGGGAGSNFITAGFSGGNGGPGCAGNGASTTAQGGGGGGGGVCEGATVSQRGTGRTPHDPANELPSGAATGAANAADCTPGGNGYAIVTYAP